MKDNIILIGMPGVGKTTAGMAAADELGMQFLDCDTEIQKAEGRGLSRILEEDGLDAFLKIEENVLSALKPSGCVVATGGSAVYSEKAMAHLKNQGTVVYLKIPYPDLEARMVDMKARGVALRPAQTLRDLYEERIPLYEKYADCIVETGNQDLRETVQQLTASLAV